MKVISLTKEKTGKDLQLENDGKQKRKINIFIYSNAEYFIKHSVLHN